MAGHLERMPKEASRHGFVLRNQTNLNRPRIGESEANPESRVAGHLERMPKEASRYGFVLRNQTNLNRPRIGESERILRAGWPDTWKECLRRPPGMVSC